MQCYSESFGMQHPGLWIGNEPFSKHVQAAVQPGVWGTQVELQVISDYF